VNVFYKAISHLFRYTKEGFGNILRAESHTALGFLCYFKQQGCYLVDLCDEPVNHLNLQKRQGSREKAVTFLSSKIRSYSPEVIIVVMKAIEDHVKNAISMACLRDVEYYSLPFPAQGNQQRYVNELIKIISDLKLKGYFKINRLQSLCMCLIWGSVWVIPSPLHITQRDRQSSLSATAYRAACLPEGTAARFATPPICRFPGRCPNVPSGHFGNPGSPLLKIASVSKREVIK
jgi:hypothetical protein